MHVLILSTPRDEHAQAVSAGLLASGASALIFDLAEFPQHLGLSMSYTGTASRFRFGCGDYGLELADCAAVWWRRPQPPVVSPAIIRASHQNFASNECVEALQGLWQSLDCRWVNDPLKDQAAQRKAYQLRVAQQVGLSIPETLITNCESTARDFVSRHGVGKVIYKAFTATEEEWRETRLLKEEEQTLLENVRYAPVIFQRYVEAAVDLRVTVVGSKVFVAAVHSQDSAYKVDYRMDWGGALVEPAILPAAVQELLLALMRRLGLLYGAIDMRHTPDGQYVFLEVNPAGQWLFIEQRTGLPITAAVTQLLLHGPEEVSGLM